MVAAWIIIDIFARSFAEGTASVRTLSPDVNILSAFMSKVDIGLNLDLDHLDDKENLKKLNPEIALKLVQFAKGVTDSSVKTADTLDMLQKGQIRVRTDFAFEGHALDTVTRIAHYAIRALIIVAVLIGSSILCTSSSFAGDNVSAVTIIFRAIGFCGLIISLFFAQRLVREMKKDK